MASGQQPVEEQVHTLLERIAAYGMLRVALAAFAAGLFLHVCVLYAVLDDGGDKAASSSRPGVVVTAAAAAPTATRPADRTSCDAIRGTDYRSETERQWFLRNCS